MPNGLILSLGWGRNENFSLHYGVREMRQSEFIDVKGELTLPLGKFTLHPLIHTHPDFTAAQDVDKKKAEPGTPPFHSLSQDVVAVPKYQKCGLKYVIYSPRILMEYEKSGAGAPQGFLKLVF